MALSLKGAITMIDRSKFEAEDFLIDATFQHYCAGTDQLSIDYWTKYISQHPEQQKTIAEAEKLYRLLSGNKSKLNERILAFQQSFEQVKVVPLKSRRIWWSVAAVLLVIGLGSIFFAEEKSVPVAVYAQTYQTKAGERKKVTLPDGSTVWLNSKSTLKLDENFNESNRLVSLQGEGYFDVTHSKKPFKVQTSEFEINVLGTAFNVKAYPDEITSEATLIRGLITMQPVNGGGIITLKPSQKITLYKKTAATTLPQQKRQLKISHPEITIDHYQLARDSTVVETAWVQNKIEILDQDFLEIKTILEKWYNVKITFTSPEIEKYRFTATFNNETIKEVLDALQQVEKFNYEIKGDQIKISK